MAVIYQTRLPLVNHNIFELDITVNNHIFVKVLQPTYNYIYGQKSEHGNICITTWNKTFTHFPPAKRYNRCRKNRLDLVLWRAQGGKINLLLIRHVKHIQYCLMLLKHGIYLPEICSITKKMFESLWKHSIELSICSTKISIDETTSKHEIQWDKNIEGGSVRALNSRWRRSLSIGLAFFKITCLLVNDWKSQIEYLSIMNPMHLHCIFFAWGLVGHEYTTA